MGHRGHAAAKIPEADFPRSTVTTRMPPLRGFRFTLCPRRLLTAIAALAVTAAWAQLPSTRVSATTLRLPPEGTTAPYKTAPAFGGLFFEQPVQIVFAPAEIRRAFVVERPGRVSLVRDTESPTREIFLDISGKTETTNGGLLSLALHPRFAE